MGTIILTNQRFVYINKGGAARVFVYALGGPSQLAGQKIRFTLATDYTIAITNAVAFTVLNLLAFYWILRRNKKGHIFLIAISIINRLISQPIFIGGIHLIFVTGTSLIVIFAYLDYRKQTKLAKEIIST